MAGRVAVISGSSRGIGAAIANELSIRGAKIVLNYLKPNLQQECELVGQRLVTEWIAVCADLTDDDGAAYLVRSAISRFGQIDVLANNVGIVPLGPLWESDMETFDTTMRLNVRGAYALVRAALPHLTPYEPPAVPRSGGSRISIIGSAASRASRASQVIYMATKGALDAVLKVWARELPPRYGSTVNLVAPGPVLTDTFKGHFTPAEWEELREMMEKDTPVEGIAASSQDIAWAVAFLAEERSRFINGKYLWTFGVSTMGLSSHADQ
jgi:NAD(P)-dependent dehydrogenase (short-subunit alcohol dehydrogenase family)